MKTAICAGDSSKFETTEAKLHLFIVTLFTKDKVNPIKQLSVGCTRSVLAKLMNNDNNTYELLSASFHSIKRLFVLAYDA